MLPALLPTGPLLWTLLECAMACPLCGEDCRCAEPEALPARRLVDPEAPDLSEERFAASLETPWPPVPPPRYSRIVMSEPRSEVEQFASAVQEQFALAPQPETRAGDIGEMWRQEVANRVENYRARRRRRTADGSLDLDFDPSQPVAVAEHVPSPPLVPAQVAAAALTTAEFAGPEPRYYGAALDEETVAPPAPEPEIHWDGTFGDAAARLPETSNVIEFPRLEEFTPANELAEPVAQGLRILDAPELMEQAVPTPMADISLEEQVAPDTSDIEIPLQVAPLPQRVFGGVVDFLIVLLGTAIFGVIVFKMVGAVATSKAFVAVAAAVPCFFWMAYQYLLLVHAGRTPGMRAARVLLVNFEGELLDRRARRWRVLAMALSCVSLGLGFIWALVDEDTLCWHDRITRTYPVDVSPH